MDEGNDSLLFRIAELFVGGKKASDIARQVNAEFKPALSLTRESVYPLLTKARLKEYIRLVPPMQNALAEKISEAFQIPFKSVTVVDTTDASSNELVATSAAEVALEFIAELSQVSAAPIGIGLGPGRATLDFSLRLSELIRADSRMMKLKLFAISAGCLAKTPEYAPVSFFNLFPRNLVSERVGLFAETLVRADRFEEVKNVPGVREAFLEKDQVRLVITSMGDLSDEHDLLRRFLIDTGTPIESLKKAGWIGNVQFRPYTATSPVVEKKGELRAVTLFELDELVTLAEKKNSHCILISRRCGLCGRTHGASLLPLLQRKNLRVFSHIVMDSETAKELLRLI